MVESLRTCNTVIDHIDMKLYKGSILCVYVTLKYNDGDQTKSVNFNASYTYNETWGCIGVTGSFIANLMKVAGVERLNRENCQG